MSDLFNKKVIDKNRYVNKYIWSARVIDNQDPLMVNRVRVTFDTPIDGSNNDAILDSLPDKFDNKTTKYINPEGRRDVHPDFQWSKIDPFCFLPLLPVFLNITPKITESVNLIWPNPDFKFSEQYYVPGPISSPFTLYKEDSISSRNFSTKGRGKQTIKLRNTENYQYFDKKIKGVFPDYDDVAILGRGTCDLIIKDKTVLLRSGKSKLLPKNADKKIDAKLTRGFLQISDFDNRIENLGPESSVFLDPDVAFVNTLIEWSILNPENNFNTFSIEIYLYKLPDSTAYTTNKIFIETDIPEIDKSLAFFVSYNNLTLNESINIINQFISQANDGKVNLPNFPITQLENVHPIIFRPSELTYKWITQGVDASLVQYKNVSSVAQSIKFLNEGINGFGLIFFKNATGQQSTPRLVERNQIQTLDTPTTYNILGADKLLLLSHESVIPSKGDKIVLGQDTMLGIDQTYLALNVVPKTNSTVRGEELMKFLNLVIRFLVSHTHAFPGLPPVSVSLDNVEASEILSRLQNAPGTILNENIRIN